jgi:hypothetical protein
MAVDKALEKIQIGLMGIWDSKENFATIRNEHGMELRSRIPDRLRREYSADRYPNN